MQVAASFLRFFCKKGLSPSVATSPRRHGGSGERKMRPHGLTQPTILALTGALGANTYYYYGLGSLPLYRHRPDLPFPHIHSFPPSFIPVSSVSGVRLPWAWFLVARVCGSSKPCRVCVCICWGACGFGVPCARHLSLCTPAQLLVPLHILGGKKPCSLNNVGNRCVSVDVDSRACDS